MQEPWLADHDSSLPKIHIGICAMDKKAHSRPMNAIVERLEAYGEFDIKYFGDETILHKPITAWPTCDCLLSWHSDGFPLAKVPAAAKNSMPCFCTCQTHSQHSSCCNWLPVHAMIQEQFLK